MVYYVTPSGRDLVPDFRWFPNGSRLATTLARAQLGRVPDYLAERRPHRCARPTPGSRSTPCPSWAGRAQVSLSSEALSADPDDRTAMWAQLTATLSQVSSVSSVSLAVDDTPLELPSGVSSAGSAAELGYDTVTNRTFDTALLRQGDELSRLDPRFLPDTTVGSRRADTKPQDGDIARIPDTWTRLALSADGKQVAAVSTGRQLLSLWQADAPQVVVPPFASSLTATRLRRAGLPLGGRRRRGRRRTASTCSTPGRPRDAATPIAVKAPWLKDRRVVSLAVAGDGVRLLVITTNEQGTDAQLGVSGIQRLPNGQPAGLAAPLRQAQPLSVLTDVVWLDTTRSTYAVLGQLTEAEPPAALGGHHRAGPRGHPQPRALVGRVGPHRAGAGCREPHHGGRPPRHHRHDGRRLGVGPGGLRLAAGRARHRRARARPLRQPPPVTSRRHHLPRNTPSSRQPRVVCLADLSIARCVARHGPGGRRWGGGAGGDAPGGVRSTPQGWRREALRPQGAGSAPAERLAVVDSSMVHHLAAPSRGWPTSCSPRSARPAIVPARGGARAATSRCTGSSSGPSRCSCAPAAASAHAADARCRRLCRPGESRRVGVEGRRPP